MNNDVIPTNYSQWREWIEGRANIRLTKEYLEQRLAELQDANHAKTKEFTRLYGADHLQRTISWFQQAANECRE